jgi:nucleoside-diphosphate-sugar epimerase
MKKKILITGGNGNIACIIKNELKDIYEITAPTRETLDVLNYENIKKYLSLNTFDVLIHTAIKGGRRTKEENGDIVYINLLMFENILKFSDKFKMIINLDSGAIYDRNTNIYNRKEDDLFTVPLDYYGFSKYNIYQRSLQYKNIYNFRIFNIFHPNEEPNRFIKACFNAKKNDTEFIINDDKYFDFVYYTDLLSILKYYINNLDNLNNQLHKTINIAYKNKYKLSDIVKLIENTGTFKKINIKILADNNMNYCGNNDLLDSIVFIDGLEKALKDYNNYI